MTPSLSFKRCAFKAGFVGSHGTGKTTLVRALNERLLMSGIKSSITEEIPRLICDSAEDPTFFRRGQNTLLRQMLLLMGQPILEGAKAQQCENILLCDRAILDHWAYTRSLFGNDIECSGIAQPTSDFVRRHCESYDLLFYVPIEFAVIDDGTREGDSAFQRAIDEEISGLLKTFDVSYHSLKGSVEDRVNSAYAKLIALLKRNEVTNE